MDFDREEQKIRQMLEPYRLKKPPEALMKNYEKEVLEKVKTSGSGPVFGWTVALSLAAIGVLILALAFIFLIPVRPAKDQASHPAPGMASKAVETAQEEAVFQKVSNELFILEMLGEDEGLFEEFLAQPKAPF